MKNHKNFCLSVSFLLAFVFWTIAACFVDVKPIGPNESSVGFATINEFFHNLTGTNMTLYTITDWLGLVPVAVCFGFALLGSCQLIKRKSILKVDSSILVLGGFYIVTAIAYLLFEKLVINYRPVLVEGFLEPSYPSSTTLFVLCVMPTAILQLNDRIENKAFKKCVNIAVIAFTAFMVFGRLLSGVHWLTDIVGGALLSTGLVLMYRCITKILPSSFGEGRILNFGNTFIQLSPYQTYRIRRCNALARVRAL